jgi:hypothetical protein
MLHELLCYAWPLLFLCLENFAKNCDLAIGSWPLPNLLVYLFGTMVREVIDIACSVPKDLQMQLKPQAETVDFHHVFVVMASSTLEITAGKMVTYCYLLVSSLSFFQALSLFPGTE